MELKLKQRLVGLIVLAALAVIIIPMFFSHSGSRSYDLAMTDKVPPRPDHRPAGEIDLITQPKEAPKVQREMPVMQNTPESLVKNTTLDSRVRGGDNVSAVVNTPANNNSPVVNTVVENKANQQPAMIASAVVTKEKVLDSRVRGNDGVQAETKVIDATPSAVADKPKEKIQAKAQTDKKTVKKSSTPPVVANAWTIQLGSFSDKANAQALVKKLRAKGFTAYLNEPKSKTALIRVFVGPETDHEKAEKMVKELANSFNLHGMIVKYKL